MYRGCHRASTAYISTKPANVTRLLSPPQEAISTPPASITEHGNPEGKHAGDLPNLEVKADGTAQLTAIADGATLGKGKTSILAKGGTALIIHQGPDDEKSDPTGNSGGRIACGVVVAQ